MERHHKHKYFFVISIILHHNHSQTGLVLLNFITVRFAFQPQESGQGPVVMCRHGAMQPVLGRGRQPHSHHPRLPHIPRAMHASPAGRVILPAPATLVGHRGSGTSATWRGCSAGCLLGAWCVGSRPPLARCFPCFINLGELLTAAQQTRPGASVPHVKLGKFSAALPQRYILRLDVFTSSGLLVGPRGRCGGRTLT